MSIISKNDYQHISTKMPHCYKFELSFGKILLENLHIRPTNLYKFLRIQTSFQDVLIEIFKNKSMIIEECCYRHGQ